MIIIGVDYHPEFQQIALLDKDSGEFQEKRLSHPEQAGQFYGALAAAGQQVRVGMEASGHARWFERLLAELGFELWIGDPAVIKTKRVRKQKTDREDARLMLKLLQENRFPKIWVPSPENRDLRQLLLAPASAGADANADHESTPGGGDERRLSLEEKAVWRRGTSTARKTLVGSLGQPVERKVAGGDLVPRARHADLRFGEVVIAHADRTEHAARGGRVDSLGYDPAAGLDVRLRACFCLGVLTNGSKSMTPPGTPTTRQGTVKRKPGNISIK